MTSHTSDLPLARSGHTCNCGESDAGFPVLDARAIPHPIRHASIFGALDSLQPGAGIVLVAPHDPVPLLDQAQERYGRGLSVLYLQRGPDAWQLQFVRQ